jgi:hypothetical protein
MFNISATSIAFKCAIILNHIILELPICVHFGFLFNYFGPVDIFLT